MKPQGIQELARDVLNTALQELLFPRLADQLRSRQAGHCMRVSDLDEGLAVDLCKRLRSEIPNTQAYILSDSNSRSIPTGFAVTSTKLVELRNPLPDGTLRAPLLIFLPPNLRTSAEDSFGVATFEQLSLPDPYGELAHSLLADLPPEIRGPSTEILKALTGC